MDQNPQHGNCVLSYITAENKEKYANGLFPTAAQPKKFQLA